MVTATKVGNNKIIIIGYFKSGKRHGRGIQVTPKYTYKGDFFNNLKHGFGHLSNTLSVYKGEFINDCFHGYGILKRNLVFDFSDDLDESTSGLSNCKF